MNEYELQLFEDTKSTILLNNILNLPKIDLHRHLTGSIDTTTAIKVAAKYDIFLPTYIESELDELVSLPNKVSNHHEYFASWPILNKLFISYESTYDVVTSIIKKASEDNIVYMELRMGPRGFLGTGEIEFEEFVAAVSQAVTDAEKCHNIIVRCILGISRHVFFNIPQDILSKMFVKMLSIVSDIGSKCFVGIDLNGDESVTGGEYFKYFFEYGIKKGFQVTVHAGEVGSTHNIEYAISELNASRIGHGIAAEKSNELLQMLSKNNCALEICPTSNLKINAISKISDLPLNIFYEHDVPFVICTDNPPRCKTTLSEELFKIAQAFSLSLDEVRNLNNLALMHSFASSDTKEILKMKILNNHQK